MRRIIWLILILVLLLSISVVAWFGWCLWVNPITQNNKPVIVYVAPGMSLKTLAWGLYHRGLLKNPYCFLLLAKWQRQLTRIKAGEYQIDPGTTLQDLLRKLVRGEVLIHKVTLVEGWTFQQVLQALANNPALKHTLSRQDRPVIMEHLGHDGKNPEGLFYPSTYLFVYGTKDSKILQMAYDLMAKKLEQAWAQRSANLNLNTPYEALIVASLVEKETAQLKERPKIAGVILRRLSLDMPLQIDASVIYGLGRYLPLTRADLTRDTEYNTYLHRGLPPTPIGMPSESSIFAALHPSKGDFLYYVAKGDGTHTFSKDLQAHHIAVTQYRAGRRSLNVPPCISAKLMISYWGWIRGGS